VPQKSGRLSGARVFSPGPGVGVMLSLRPGLRRAIRSRTGVFLNDFSYKTVDAKAENARFV
jgi:hypothetical protein